MIKPCFDGSSALDAPMLWERGRGGRLLVGWLAWPLAPDFDFPGPRFLARAGGHPYRSALSDILSDGLAILSVALLWHPRQGH